MSKRLTKPTMRMEWRGREGSKHRVWVVRVDGKDYYHVENRPKALKQFEAAMRFYKKRLALRKKK